jgi:hypothetical protein
MKMVLSELSKVLKLRMELKSRKKMKNLLVKDKDSKLMSLKCQVLIQISKNKNPTPKISRKVNMKRKIMILIIEIGLKKKIIEMTAMITETKEDMIEEMIEYKSEEMIVGIETDRTSSIMKKRITLSIPIQTLENII